MVKKCWGNRCPSSEDFTHSFLDHRGMGEDAINMKCNDDWCDVKVCTSGKCNNHGKIVKQEIERDVARMPRCSDVGRWKKSFLNRLSGFCCNIVTRGGLKFIQLLKIKRKIG